MARGSEAGGCLDSASACRPETGSLRERRCSLDEALDEAERVDETSLPG